MANKTPSIEAEVERLSIDDAVEFAAQLLEKVGLPKPDARTSAEHLVAAEARGYPGHGLRRILGISSLADQIGAEHANQIRKESVGSVFFDGRGRLGIAAVQDAILEAARKTSESTTIAFGVTGYVGTTGSLGIYGQALSSLGLVSVLMCNSEFAVAPHGSKRAVLGTNPIAIAMPGHPTAFNADLATSAWSYGAIKDAAAAGHSIPEGVVQTENGQPSTDPADADNGSQLPLAGHKGYALGLAVELLCGPLIGGKAGRSAVAGSDGFFGILIRADAARPAEDFDRDAQALFSEILQGPPIDPSHPIRIPGTKAQQAQGEARHINIPADLMRRLRSLTG